MIEVQNFIPVGTFFVPIELARKVAFDPYLASHEDWDYLLKLYALAPFQHIDIWGFRYHKSPGPRRNKVSRQEGRADYLSIYRRHRASNLNKKRERAELLDRIGIQQRPHTL